MLNGNQKKSGDRLAMGIDIGSESVKFVIADEASSRVDIKGASSFGIPYGMIQDGVVKEPRKFARILSSKLTEYEFQRANAVISVPSNLATLRWVTLPLLEGEELRDAARYKVKRHLPFPVESAYVEASAPSPDEDDHTGQSLVIAVRKEVIDSRAEGVELAGVQVVGAELEAQAILRVVERRLNEQSALWRDASLTIIDVGANTTHMYVVQNQKLQFIRGVKFGGHKIAEAVATEFNCTLQEADKLLSHPETKLSPDGILHLKMGDLPARVSVQQEVEKLTREFLRLLRYFRSLHPERSYAGILDHVIVCGGLTSLQGLDEYLQVVLGLRVERAKPFAGMIGKFNRETFDTVANRQEAFTVSVGLSLSALAGKNISIGDDSVRREFAWARSA
ncbi:MAG TPA: type IV pilus assembly protein PilM [Fimbriimonadaceae bacterium]|jgi:type IV pilus assembly protein PilM